MAVPFLYRANACAAGRWQWYIRSQYIVTAYWPLQCARLMTLQTQKQRSLRGLFERSMIIKMTEPILVLNNIHKNFGEVPVLKGINLEIARGEFITLLGSSGCGKTTTLRIVAGLEQPDEGSVILEGKDVTTQEPNKRDVNTIFQNYALFPHMNVEENVGYGLRLAKCPKAEIKKKVQEALTMVQMEGFEKRKVTELSGGQKQRVAIARAIVKKPKVLLLDEPLGALDLQLRRQMQLELKRLQKKLGITFIYITHDQEEAINMSDRIVVMNEGVFEQMGTPNEIYFHPKSSYVAQFMGNSNILQGVFEQQVGDYLELLIGGERVMISGDGKDLHPKKGDIVRFALRSENILLPVDRQKQEAKWNLLPAVVTEKSFAGGMLRLELTLADHSTVTASRHGIDCEYQTQEELQIGFLPEAAVAVLDGGEGISE